MTHNIIGNMKTHNEKTFQDNSPVQSESPLDGLVENESGDASDIIHEPEGLPSIEVLTETVNRSEVDRLVAEAERQGYLRARNELAQVEINRTQLLGNPLLDRQSSRNAPDAESSFVSGFLTRIPRGVWD